MSQQIKPLSYSQTADTTVTPGSLLTLTRGSRGATGQWVPRAAEELVDPSDAAVDVATMVSAFNQLVWSLAGQGLVQTEPRLWFGATGLAGTGRPAGVKLLTTPSAEYQYSNYVPSSDPPLFRIADSGSGKIYTVEGESVSGYIYGWRILTGLWSSVIESTIYINGVQADLVYVMDSTAEASVVKWREVRATIPILVSAGDTIQIRHSSGAPDRLYNMQISPVEEIIADVIIFKDITAYIPYSSPPPNTQELSTALTALNTAVGSANAAFSYQGGGVTMIVKPVHALMFADPDPPTSGGPIVVVPLATIDDTSYDTGLRIMRRFLPGLKNTIFGPSFLQGTAFTGPIVGVSAIPASVTDLINAGTTETSISVEWGSAEGAAYYYVWLIEPTGKKRVVTVTGTSFQFVGLTPDTSYIVRVYGANDFEMGESLTDLIVTTAGGGVNPPSFSLSTEIELVNNIVFPQPFDAIYIDVGLDLPTVSFAPDDSVIMELEEQVTSDPDTYSPITSVVYSPGIDFFDSQWVSMYSYFEGNPIRFYGLSPKKTYRVRARYEIAALGGLTPFSEYLSILTTTPTLELQEGNITENSVEITWGWSYINMYDLSKYSLELSLDGTVVTIPTVAVDDGSSSGGSYLIEGLTSNTSYTITGKLIFNITETPQIVHIPLPIEVTTIQTPVPVPELLSFSAFIPQGSSMCTFDWSPTTPVGYEFVCTVLDPTTNPDPIELFARADGSFAYQMPIDPSIVSVYGMFRQINGPIGNVIYAEIIIN